MQTKKRAKPVKFGKAAKEKEAEKKVEAPVEEPAVKAAPPPEPAEPATPAQPQTPAEPQAQGGGELVDKLSDVPFETDFGTPAAPAASAAPAATPPQAAPEPQQPAEPNAPEEVKSDNLQAVPSAFDSPTDTSPTAPSQSAIPPIGRANEPIPFNPHETVFNTPPDAGEHKKNPFLYFIVIAFVAFVTGIAFMAGIYYAMPNKDFFSMLSVPSMPSIPGVTEASPTPKPVAQVSPTVAPETEAKLSDYSIKVLNGSGVSGQAAKVKASLTAEGFTVASTGNADSSDVEKTQITYRKKVTPAALTKVKDILKKTYVLEKETLLPASDTTSSDITITIGKETAN